MEIKIQNTTSGQAMHIHPLSLKFSGMHSYLERDFLTEYTQASLKHIRIAFLSGIFLVSVFGILDYFLLPDKKHITWTIRFLVICPYLAAIIFISYYRIFHQWMQLALSSAAIVTGLGIILMVIIAPPPINYSYYAGLILVIIYLYTFIRLRFFLASITGWLIVALYQVAALGFSDTPVIFIINNNFFFIGANMIGMMAGYFIEFTARRDFFISRLLIEEQQKVLEVNSLLEQKVEERTIELTNEIVERKKAQEEQIKLEQKLRQVEKMEAIGTLAGGIAHDFNNILTVINGHAEISLLKTKPTDKMHNVFKNIFDAGKRAEKLTSQLLAFSRKQVTEVRVLDINETISDLDKMMRRLIPEDIEISLKYGLNLPAIKADPGQIEQILINLIVNARDAIKANISQDAKRKIVLKTACIDLDNQFVIKNPESRTGPHIILSVADSGTGMTDAIRKRVFEPFFTTKDVDKGTGLGLATVYGIVKQNQGNIIVRSEPNAGSTFEIYWPVTDEKVVDKKNIASTLPKIKGNAHILFVEDDEDVRNLSCTALQEFGFEVSEAKDGNAALKFIEKNSSKIDLLITDLVMPKVNGIELMKRLGDSNTIKNSLYVSGYPKDYFDQDKIDITKLNFLKKPYTIPVLLNKIQEILN